MMMHGPANVKFLHSLHSLHFTTYSLSLFYLTVSYFQGNLFPCSHTTLVIQFLHQYLPHVPYITGFLPSGDGGSRFLQHHTTSLPRAHSITSLNTATSIVHCVCQTDNQHLELQLSINNQQDATW